MNDDCFFNVAGLPFSVALPEGWEAETLLPSFLPFRCGACPEEERVFRLAVATRPFTADGQASDLLDESYNDLGHVRLSRGTDGYRMDIDYGVAAGKAVHTLITDSGFSRATAYFLQEDPYVKVALSSMLRILFAQAVILHGGCSIHASCVSLKGGGYLFLGKSGTGKSTHARQWLKAFPGSTLLNDDNPALRITDGGVVTAYGTPWSGKTHCYRNEGYPVAGIVRLRQAHQNRYFPLEGPDAFAALLPSCSAIRQDVRLRDALHDTLARLTELVRVGRMECLPDEAAARICLLQLSEQ